MVRLILSLFLLFAPVSTAYARPCLHVEMITAIAVVAAEMGGGATITSTCFGEHKVGSKHYEGYAVDFRIRHIPKQRRPALAEAVSEALGDDYDVVLELTHLHVEWDPD